jgi:hypothetical protein
VVVPVGPVVRGGVVTGVPLLQRRPRGLGRLTERRGIALCSGFDLECLVQLCERTGLVKAETTDIPQCVVRCF